MLDIIKMFSAKNGNESGPSLDSKSVEAIPMPPVATKLDPIYECFCRILMLVARQPVARSVMVAQNGVTSPSRNVIARNSSLTSLLAMGVLHVGDTAAQAALDVFD